MWSSRGDAHLVLGPRRQVRQTVATARRRQTYPRRGAHVAAGSPEQHGVRHDAVGKQRHGGRLPADLCGERAEHGDGDVFGSGVRNCGCGAVQHGAGRAAHKTKQKENATGGEKTQREDAACKEEDDWLISMVTQDSNFSSSQSACCGNLSHIFLATSAVNGDNFQNVCKVEPSAVGT